MTSPLPSTTDDDFDVAASRERCRAFRRRVLDLSQRVTALHVAPAFSCLEMLDAIYFGLMRRGADGMSPDTFVLSKGHGCMAQYVVLEHLGILSTEELDAYCTLEGRLGGHPDRGLPGIETSTGSLGHGLSMCVGIAHAAHIRGVDENVYVVLSDGEVQEGSVWEAALMAPGLKLDNLVAFIDNNDFQSLGRTSETHPNFYPLAEKFAAFGWDAVEVDGHDTAAIVDAVRNRKKDRPMMVVCHTIKGKGVSYMEGVPIWHYRAPSPDEYRQALEEIEATGP